MKLKDLDNITKLALERRRLIEAFDRVVGGDDGLLLISGDRESNDMHLPLTKDAARRLVQEQLDANVVALNELGVAEIVDVTP